MNFRVRMFVKSVVNRVRVGRHVRHIYTRLASLTPGQYVYYYLAPELAVIQLRHLQEI